ncbi:MAG: 2-hydroxyacid dehydrogenase [Acidobacteriota bacterium]
MSATILITRQLPETVLQRLGEACQYRCGVVSGSITRAALLAGVEGVDGLICQLTDRIDEEVIAAGSKLRIIANVAVGYNNIDLEAASRRGIHVTNTPDVLTEATADLTWALILAVTRRVVEADAFLRAGRFDGWDFDMLLGMGLTGKSIGLIGYGRIGHAVARRAAGFGLRVQYCNREDVAFRDDPGYRNRSVASPPVTSPFNQSAHFDGLAAHHVSFPELIESSDIISLHTPLAPTTRHLIDRDVLRCMKKGAYLINTARGPIVDEAALVEALESGHLAGAGLDVFEDEPRVHPGLLPRQDVVLLPHIGSATRETRTAMARLAVDNVLDLLAGRVPRNKVN